MLYWGVQQFVTFCFWVLVLFIVIFLLELGDCEDSL
jgi:hypothetical protein